MKDRPLLVPCQSASPASRLAAAAARALGADAAADTQSAVEAAQRAVSIGRGVATLDGCAGSCMSRLIAANGIEAVATLRLDELGVPLRDQREVEREALVAELARRIDAGSTSRSAGRPQRHGRAAHLPGASVHSIDDYLLALDVLASPVVECGGVVSDAPTLAIHVSEALGVTRASASEALGRIESGGLVRRGSHKELVLTASGRARADRVVRRHRVVECFVVAYLGYPLAEAYARAREVEASFDDESIVRLRRSLGDPERCPHGWPIDPAQARRESAELRTLASLCAGERLPVVRVTEHDEEVLRTLLDLGIVPGAVLVGRGSGRAGAFSVEVAGQPALLTADEATAVFLAGR